jgi:hypothetical protein
MIDLAGCAWRIGLVRHRRTHILVTEDVAGADNHLNNGPTTNWYDLKLSIDQAIFRCKDKIAFYRDSNLGDLKHFLDHRR